MIKKIYYNGSVFEPLTPTGDQTKAIDSGITAEKVTTYDGYQDLIDGKQDELNRTITLTGDVTGTVTDTGSNISISTTQEDNTLQEVLDKNNTATTNLVISKDSNTSTISSNKIESADSNANNAQLTPGTLKLSSNAGNLQLSFVNGFSISASDGIADTIRDWLGSLPTTDDITGVGYYADANAASAAPNGILAFYPET